MKTYTTASNARRAAKKTIDMDRPEEHIDFTIHGSKESGFTWRRVQVETKAPVATKPAPITPPVAGEYAEPPEDASQPDDAPTRQYRKGSVREVWDICEANPDLRRKDVIDLCVAKGINYYTARTQYQAWRTAVKNSQ